MTEEDQNAKTVERGNRLSSALGWTIGSNLAQEGILSAVTLVLAALLKPSEFGAVAMALIFVSFIQLTCGMGFSTALIQKKDLTNLHLNSIFWITVVSSIILSGLSIVLSGWWARLNHLPELQNVITALALMIPIDGCSIVQESVLQKSMNFKALALRKNISSIIAGAVGIGAAFAGFGVWALVVQQITRSISSACFVWGASKFRPSFVFSKSCVMELVPYSSHVFLGGLGDFAQAYSNSLLMGLFCGPTAVGLFRMADRLVEMALKLVTRSFQVVALPHFSQFQDDPKELNRSLAFFYRSSGMITIPALGFLAVAAPVVFEALGPQWSSAVKVLQILCVVGFVKAITLFIGPVLQAVSRPGALAWIVWGLAVANAGGIALYAICFPNRPEDAQAFWVALIRAGIFLLLFLPLYMALARRLAKIELRSIVNALMPCMLTTALVMAAVFGVLLFKGAGRMNAMCVLAASAAVSALIVGASAWYWTPSIRQKLDSALIRLGVKTPVASVS